MNKLLTVFKHFSLHEKVLFWSYTVLLVGCFFYSYTQVDLSLTFSRIEFLRNLVFSFQHIGYFDRQLSSILFIALFIGFSAFYFYFLSAGKSEKLKKPFVWALLGVTTLILTFAYNAFSYDLFNYMFDAKIITHYQQNPYEHKALDYPGDPMLSYMHWTHRTYPYGPVWLLLTVPLQFLGFNLFIPTFMLFKGLMAVSFLGSLYFIGKIFQKIAPEKELFGLVFFGLNPLVLFESLVSAHLDIVMIVFSLWALYMLMQKKHVWSLVLLGVSIGIKFATVFLLPVFFWVIFQQYRRKTINWNDIFLFSTILMAAAIVVASMRTTFQPWYLVDLLFIAVFLAPKYYIFSPTVIISSFALLTYLPYLYLGNWDKPVPQFLSTLYMTSYISSSLLVGGQFILTTDIFKPFSIGLRKTKLSPARLKIPKK